MAGSSILVVEDERIVAKDIQLSLQSLGYAVPTLAASGEEAFRKAVEFCPDLVLIDIHLEGDMDGVAAAQQIYSRLHIPIVYLTAHSDALTLQRAKEVGPFGYILKPFEERDLLATIETALQRAQLEKKLRESEQWWATALRSVSDATIATDACGAVTFMNPAAEVLTGWQQSEAFGKDATEIFKIVQELTPTKFENPITQVLQTGAVVELAEQTRLITRNGVQIPIDESVAPIKDDLGKIVGAILVFRNITERLRAKAMLQQSNDKLLSWANELEQRNHEMTLLGQLNDVLQSCLTVEEAYSALATLVPPLFPQTSGQLFLLDATKNLVESVSTWGSPALTSLEVFAPHQCWALRRGRVHRVEDRHSGLRCQHLPPDLSTAASLCIPMMAQGETMGVLYLSSLESGPLTPTRQQLATTVAEHIALALANLKLHSMLQEQSLRDPLTGLFNRRYMEESLERELHLCERRYQSLSLLMLDIDYFKRFNDKFGHAAGDTVLRELSLFLQKHVRTADIICRYGGEELTLILPNTSLEIARQRAEQLCQEVKHLRLEHRYQLLDTVTLSLGIACFPEHGLTKDVLLQAADAALYHAKASGRDRVSVYEREFFMTASSRC